MRRFHGISIFLGCVLLLLLVWGIGPGELWREMALLAVGLFITTTVFYIVKRTVLPRGGGHH